MVSATKIWGRSCGIARIEGFPPETHFTAEPFLAFFCSAEKRQKRLCCKESLRRKSLDSRDAATPLQNLGCAHHSRRARFCRGTPRCPPSRKKRGMMASCGAF